MMFKLHKALDAQPIPATKIEARGIAHTLSNASKMPGYSYGTPSGKGYCGTGGLLVDKPGSVCNICYADGRGCYNWQSTINAQHKRLDAIANPEWPQAMVKLIGNKPDTYFRWFDSGDIPSFLVLLKILWICKQTYNVQHWLPTKEVKLIRQYLKLYGADRLPDNLNIRVSSPMIDQGPLQVKGVNTSTVHDKKKHYGKVCPAPLQGNKCGRCRACWNKEIPNISYHKH